MTIQKTIIGIDPGTILTGYGILRCHGSQAEMVAMGVLQLGKMESHYRRLQEIYRGVGALIRRYRPDELAIEAPFYGKNVQTMLKLGRAQGVAIAAALESDLPITEYAPKEVKRAITGNGAASKEQVADLLRRMLKIPQESMLPQLDATDGLAVAFCHYIQLTSPLPRSSAGSWKDYIKNHPEKVRGL